MSITRFIRQLISSFVDVQAPQVSHAVAKSSCESPRKVRKQTRRKSFGAKHRAGTRRCQSQKSRHDAASPKVFAQKTASRKPAYHLIPEGATLLIDMANILGAMDPLHAAHTFATIEATLVSRGFRALFFVENRALMWMCCHQENQNERNALEAFCGKSNVTRVSGKGEADLVMLQTARSLLGSICVTRDRFRDYAATYSEIVGTKRHRTCAAVTLDDKVLLSIDGLRDPIAIEREIPQTVVVTETISEESVSKGVPQTVLTEEVATSAQPSRKGLLAVGDACRAKGDVAKAVALYGRAAKKDPSIYFDIADLYSTDEDGEAGYRRAVKFTRLGQKNAKKLSERKLRQARLRAEMHRGGCRLSGWRRAA